MLEVTRTQLVRAFHALGIQPGDGLLVHSAIQYMGVPMGGVVIYLQALKDVIGEQGTIAVPTFNFGFARGEVYDPQTTPSQGMGIFSEFIRQQPGALRTPHPMQSLAILGQYANDLASLDTPSAFDPGSSFERLLNLNFKVLLLGANINAISLLHYSEQRAQVPYRYWKDFTGKIKTTNEIRSKTVEIRSKTVGWMDRTYRMFVRDLDLDPRLDLMPVQQVLQERGQWFSTSLNYGQIARCQAVDFVSVTDEILSTDPWSLVTNRPA